MIVQTNGRLRIEGPMNIETARALLAELQPMLAQGDTVLDLAAVSEVDSAALAVVFDCLRTASAKGHRCRLSSAPAAFSSLAELYGISDLLNEITLHDSHGSTAG